MLFILDKPEVGVAIVNADNPEQALQLLQQKEKQDRIMGITHGATAKDMKPLELKKPGIVSYSLD